MNIKYQFISLESIEKIILIKIIFNKADQFVINNDIIDFAIFVSRYIRL